MNAESIAIVLTTAREPIVVIVEALPLILGLLATPVLELTVVQLTCLIEVLMQLLEVEANCAAQFTTIQQNEELGLNASVEILLHQGCFVTIYAEMLEVLEQSCCILVIFLNLGDYGVPCSCEIQKSEGWPLGV